MKKQGQSPLVEVAMDKTPPPAVTPQNGPLPPTHPQEDSATTVPASADASPVPPTPPAADRLLSLDAFRGLTILLMLLVNNAALDTATPKHLTHAPWNGGVYLADLVFPWFLFIVGVALPWSVASLRKRGGSWWGFLGKAFGRATALFLLGCLIDSSLALTPVFGLGVLQLIGLAYLLAIFFLRLPVVWRLGVAAALLVGHWATLRFVPVPGVGAGVFTEEANVVRHLNGVYLQGLGLKGLVSVVPTAAMVLIGSAVGEWLRLETVGPPRRVGGLIVGGGMLALAGWLWNLDLPFNKPVWTASYILFCAGLGMWVLALFYLVMDVWRRRWWATPLVIFGSNAIVAYVAPILVKVHVLREWTWTLPDGIKRSLEEALLLTSRAEFGKVGGGALYTAGYILVWWLVLWVLYRKRLFLRV
jgi:predicted acyltransferase